MNLLWLIFCRNLRPQLCLRLSNDLIFDSPALATLQMVTGWAAVVDGTTDCWLHSPGTLSVGFAQGEAWSVYT